VIIKKKKKKKRRKAYVFFNSCTSLFIISDVTQRCIPCIFCLTKKFDTSPQNFGHELPTFGIAVASPASRLAVTPMTTLATRLWFHVKPDDAILAWGRGAMHSSQLSSDHRVTHPCTTVLSPASLMSVTRKSPVSSVLTPTFP